MQSSTNFYLPAQADQGFRDASSYDQHRPSHPPSAVSSLLEHLKLAGQANSKIVEIGAGTGKFTEILAAREEGFEIVAVEPHREMRESLVGENLGSSERGSVKVVEGNAAKTGLEEEWGDACIAAQVQSKSCDILHHGFVLKLRSGFSLVPYIQVRERASMQD
jgi:protein-L-isoaspartate O-methyltransferase